MLRSRAQVGCHAVERAHEHDSESKSLDTVHLRLAAVSRYPVLNPSFLTRSLTTSEGLIQLRASGSSTGTHELEIRTINGSRNSTDLAREGRQPCDPSITPVSLAAPETSMKRVTFRGHAPKRHASLAIATEAKSISRTSPDRLEMVNPGQMMDSQTSRTSSVVVRGRLGGLFTPGFIQATVICRLRCALFRTSELESASTQTHLVQRFKLAPNQPLTRARPMDILDYEVWGDLHLTAQQPRG